MIIFQKHLETYGIIEMNQIIPQDIQKHLQQINFVENLSQLRSTTIFFIL